MQENFNGTRKDRMKFEFKLNSLSNKNEIEELEKFWDLIIVGCGIAGLTAGLFAGRYKLKTLIICKDLCGNLNIIETIENFPGFESISGNELCGKIVSQIKKYNVKILRDEVLEIKKSNDNFEVITTDKKFYCKAIIIATGTRRKKLNVPGEELKGVCYCATCDAPLFKNKVVAIIGGGNTAAHEALILSKYASKVFIIHRRDSLKVEKILLDKVLSSDNIEVIHNSEVIEIKGKNKVEKIVIKDKVSGKIKDLEVDGVFVAIGLEPISEIVKNLDVELDENGFIKVDECMRTNVEGIFAAGDVTNGSCNFKQLITAAAQGAIAALSAYKFILSKRNKAPGGI